uniref:Ovule protein n=1 Tax=Syphacia muris TaxID=451379 RepID=A0A0N5AZH1_9BILA
MMMVQMMKRLALMPNQIKMMVFCLGQFECYVSAIFKPFSFELKLFNFMSFKNFSFLLLLLREHER